MSLAGSRRYPLERAIFQLLAWFFLRRHGRLHVEGLEHLPAVGPAILVGNHIATLDPPLVGALVPRLDVHYMAKAESFRGRWAGFLLRGWNGFPVVRHSADRAAIEHALDVLAAGHVLVIFPEGSRSPDASLGRAYPGVGLLARRSGAPVVCAAIWGSEVVLPKGCRWPRSADVNVRYGAPLRLAARLSDGRRLTNQEAADLVMRRLAGLLPPAYRGVYAQPQTGAAPRGGVAARVAAAR